MSQSTRSALIAIARRHFSESGYAAISMEDITTAAQLTRGALYHHFGSKSGLFKAVVDDIDEEIDAMFRARTEFLSKSGEEYWQEVRIGSHCFLEALRRPDIRQIVLLDAPTHYANFARRSTRLHCHQSTVSALQSLIAQRRIRVKSAEAAYHMIEGVIAGLISWASDHEVGLKETKTEFDHFLDSLIVGQY